MQLLDVTATAYCGCGECCSWEHGLTLGRHYICLDSRRPFVHVRRRNWTDALRQPQILDRYWKPITGNLAGKLYDGTTASGVRPRQARPGLLSPSVLFDPSRLLRRVLLPWQLFGQTGTIAADTSVFPMGTAIHVPGYGWGRVEDRGGAIQGRTIDLFHQRHHEALLWGRQQLKVRCVKPGRGRLDAVPPPLRAICRCVAAVHTALFAT